VDSSPVTVGDRVFFGSDDGRLYGLDVKTGKQVFQHICGERVTATPAIADGRLVIGDGEGNVYCFGSK
jgi:outer membrane protein assembly factor BamB